MSGNTRHRPVRMSKQIYAEAESNARGRRQMQTKFACSRRSFALPRRYSICSRQAKYTQKPRAEQIYLFCRGVNSLRIADFLLPLAE